MTAAVRAAGADDTTTVERVTPSVLVLVQLPEGSALRAFLGTPEGVAAFVGADYGVQVAEDGNSVIFKENDITLAIYSAYQADYFAILAYDIHRLAGMSEEDAAALLQSAPVAAGPTVYGVTSDMDAQVLGAGLAAAFPGFNFANLEVCAVTLADPYAVGACGGSRYLTGDHCHPQCIDGYAAANTPTITCGGNGAFSLPTPACVDIDECASSDANKCVDNAHCQNTPGAYTCSCPAGYLLAEDGFTCNNIDECAAATDPCGGHGQCVDTNGGYQCTCDAGFVETDGACVGMLTAG